MRVKAVAYTIVAILAALGLLAADVGATWLRRQISGPPPPSARVPSPVYHHDLAPSFAGTDRWGSTVVPFFTNSLGCRDGQVREALIGPDTLLLGDSFAEGIGVPFAESFAAQLGEGVLNAAVASYSPVIYYRKAKYLLEEKGVRPRRVVVFLDLSDIADANFYRLRPDETVEAYFPKEVHLVRRFLARDSLQWIFSEHTTALGALYRAGYCAIYREACRYALWSERANWTREESLWRQFGERGMSEATAHLDRLAELLAARGIPLTLVVYPWPTQIYHGDVDNWHVTYWRAWSARRKATFVDLFPAFGRETLETHFIPGDVHWNAAGHRLVADELKRSVAHGGVAR